MLCGRGRETWPGHVLTRGVQTCAPRLARRAALLALCPAGALGLRPLILASQRGLALFALVVQHHDAAVAEGGAQLASHVIPGVLGLGQAGAKYWQLQDEERKREQAVLLLHHEERRPELPALWAMDALRHKFVVEDD